MDSGRLLAMSRIAAAGEGSGPPGSNGLGFGGDHSVSHSKRRFFWSWNR